MLEQRLVGPRRLDGLAPPANWLQPGCRQVDHGIPAAERNPVLTAPAGGARLTCVAQHALHACFLIYGSLSAAEEPRAGSGAAPTLEARIIHGIHGTPCPDRGRHPGQDYKDRPGNARGFGGGASG